VSWCFSWSFSGKREVRSYCAVKRDYWPSKVLPRSFDDGRRATDDATPLRVVGRLSSIVFFGLLRAPQVSRDRYLNIDD